MQEETVLAAGAAEESLPCVKGGGICEANDGGIVRSDEGQSKTMADNPSVRAQRRGQLPLHRGAETTPPSALKGADSSPYTGEPLKHDDKRQRFRELVGGEFKEIYAEEVQRIIDRRFKKTKELEKRLAELEGKSLPCVKGGGICEANDGGIVRSDEGQSKTMADNPSVRAQRRGQLPLHRGAETTPPSALKGADSSPYTGEPNSGLDELVAALMENEQRDAKARRDAERLQRDVASLRERYPDLDANALLDSDAYLRAYLDGAPLEDLLWAQHHDALVKQAQQSVVENIRARGARPSENGANGGATFTVHKDFSKMSLDELEAYGKH